MCSADSMILANVLAFFNKGDPILSVIRDLKPVCYNSVSPAWWFGGQHPRVLVRIRGHILSAHDIPSW